MSKFNEGDLVRFKRDTKYPGYQRLQNDIMVILDPDTDGMGKNRICLARSLVYGGDPYIFESEIELIEDEVMAAAYKWGKFLG